MSLEKIAAAVKIASALYGAVRKKDPGETRADAIARSAGTSSLTGSGAMLGAYAGGAAGLASHKEGRSLMADKSTKESLKASGKTLLHRGVGGAAAGAALGGIAAYNTFKRKPKKDD